MRKITIKGLMNRIILSSAWTDRTDAMGYPAYREGAMVAHHPDHPYVFVWREAERNPRSRMSVHERIDYDRPVRVSDYVNEDGLLRDTIADVVCYDRAEGKIIVSYGPVGMKRAVARWIKDNV